jgi:hypothetical protein
MIEVFQHTGTWVVVTPHSGLSPDQPPARGLHGGLVGRKQEQGSGVLRGANCLAPCIPHSTFRDDAVSSTRSRCRQASTLDANGGTSVGAQLAIDADVGAVLCRRMGENIGRAGYWYKAWLPAAVANPQGSPACFSEPWHLFSLSCLRAQP